MIVTRLVTEKDLPILAEINVQAYNSLNIGEQWTHETSLLLMKHLFKTQSDLFFVAEYDKKVAGGIVALIKPWWDGNHLTDGEFIVHPDYQKHGIGTKLIEHLFIAALEKYNAISWDTFTHVVHEQPLKWYKKLGFHQIKEWTMITGNSKQVLQNIHEHENAERYYK